MNDENNAEGGCDGPGLLSRLKGMFGATSDGQELADAIENGDSNATLGLPLARREMIERVVAFDEKKVVDVMAPRADISALDIETPMGEIIKLFAEAGHSRMPIYRGDLDDPIGMVHIKDLIGLIAHDASLTVNAKGAILKEIRREVLYVPPSMLVTDLLLRMQASRIHMALVIDEYGGTDGLVTIEDLVEEIVGEINDEHDEDDLTLIRPHGNGGWEVDARAELVAFADETGVFLQPDDDEIGTVGGYVVSLAGRVPQRGEVLIGTGGYDFEITEADARKVRKIRIHPSTVVSKNAAE